jgi:Flp pilus assembly protein TadD
MPDDPRVEQLLEELLDSDSTPEEACRACPELLPHVRAGWQRLRALRAEIGELFPRSPLFGDGTPPPLPTTETLRQVIAQDPVAPSRLNANVPRDLETVCLKCLHKEPHLRYASAAALAEDLHRFLRGEAITARPEGRLGRLVRLVRQRPALSAAVTVSALLLVVLFGGGLWVFYERSANRRVTEAAEAATERAADYDVQEMVRRLKKSAWREARAALELAKSRLGERGSPELRQRMDQGQRDLELALKVEAISLRAEAGPVGETNAAEYEVAFRAAGLGQLSENPEVVAARIRASDIRDALVIALDEWTFYDTDLQHQKWLSEVARLADPDPGGWRALVGDPTNLIDEATLNRLMKTAPRPFPSLPLLRAIQLRLTAEHKDPVPLLTRIQEVHPDDFWINYTLGGALIYRNPGEAVRYLQAAVGLRPNAVNANIALGNALCALGRLDEAVAKYRRVEELAPTNFGIHVTLATVLSQLGRYDEADVQFRRTVALDPKSTNAQNALRSFLVQHGRAEHALLEWKNTIAAHPTDHDAWCGYAELCLFVGREDEYRSARQSLLSRFGTSTDPTIAARTGRACLLLHAEGDELRQAVALAERAGGAQRSGYAPHVAHFLFVQALAEYRQGKFDRTISLLQGEAFHAFGPAPGIVLAMALHRNGKVAEARKTLAKAVLSHDWRANQARDQDDWIYRVLRREAEGMILPNLPAFLDGKYEPRDNDERLALLGVCQFRNRALALARLYADAFAAAPQLAEDVGAGHRFSAARAAALAGSGRGEDGARVSQKERTRSRKQARAWLELDLAVLAKKLRSGNPADRFQVRQRMSAWLADPDFARLREPGMLGEWSVEEREEWLALWKEVGALVNRAAGS